MSVSLFPALLLPLLLLRTARQGLKSSAKVATADKTWLDGNCLPEAERPIEMYSDRLKTVFSHRGLAQSKIRGWGLLRFRMMPLARDAV